MILNIIDHYQITNNTVHHLGIFMFTDGTRCLMDDALPCEGLSLKLEKSLVSVDFLEEVRLTPHEDLETWQFFLVKVRIGPGVSLASRIFCSKFFKLFSISKLVL